MYYVKKNPKLHLFNVGDINGLIISNKIIDPRKYIFDY